MTTFNSLPIKQVGPAVVTVGDVSHVHLGGPPQTNAVLVRGKQAVLLEVLKAGDASTLAVVAGVKAKLPIVERVLPAGAGVKITVLNDASTFVRAAARAGSVSGPRDHPHVVRRPRLCPARYAS